MKKPRLSFWRHMNYELQPALSATNERPSQSLQPQWGYQMTAVPCMVPAATYRRTTQLTAWNADPISGANWIAVFSFRGSGRCLRHLFLPGWRPGNPGTTDYLPNIPAVNRSVEFMRGWEMPQWGKRMKARRESIVWKKGHGFSFLRAFSSPILFFGWLCWILFGWVAEQNVNSR